MAIRGPGSGWGGDLRRGSKPPEHSTITTRGCSGDTLAEQVTGGTELGSCWWHRASSPASPSVPQWLLAGEAWQRVQSSLTRSGPSRYLSTVPFTEPSSVVPTATCQGTRVPGMAGVRHAGPALSAGRATGLSEASLPVRMGRSWQLSSPFHTCAWVVTLGVTGVGHKLWQTSGESKPVRACQIHSV